jgi:hypothetical protein
LHSFHVVVVVVVATWPQLEIVFLCASDAFSRTCHISVTLELVMIMMYLFSILLEWRDTVFSCNMYHHIAFIIRVTTIGELGTAIAVNSN